MLYEPIQIENTIYEVMKMKKFIEYERLSKKEQKKINSARRNQWSDYGGMSPVTRIVADKKKECNKRICRHNNRVDKDFQL